MRRPRSSRILPLVLLVLVSACRRPSRDAEQDAGTPRGPVATLTLKGSDTLVILGQRWAEQYMKAHPGARIQVNGGGSGTGIAALLNGTTDIAMASRALQDTERERMRQKHPEGPVEVPVALDGIAFYVHADNPVDTLTLAQLKAIYQGDLTRWTDVGGPDRPITVYSRESSSGTYAFVKERVLQGQDFTERAQTLAGTAAVVNAVSLDPNGLGFGGAAYLRGVKPLKVGAEPATAVHLSADSLRTGAYPLARTLSFVLSRPPTGLARNYIDHALTPEGQRTVIDTGYFPVK